MSNVIKFANSLLEKYEDIPDRINELMVEATSRDECLLHQKWEIIIDLFRNDENFIQNFRESKDTEILTFEFFDPRKYHFFDWLEHKGGALCDKFPIDNLIRNNPLYIGEIECRECRDRATIENLLESVFINDLIQSCGPGYYRMYFEEVGKVIDSVVYNLDWEVRQIQGESL